MSDRSAFFCRGRYKDEHSQLYHHHHYNYNYYYYNYYYNYYFYYYYYYYYTIENKNGRCILSV